MDDITGKIIGDIHITVCKSSMGKELFYLRANNTDVLPVLDYLESSLTNYLD